MYWYLVIFLVPGIGALIYLITQVFSKQGVKKVQTNVTTVINPTKKVRTLEQKVEFADTFQNRLDLADAYLELKDYGTAISAYKVALSGSETNDFYGNTQLIEAFFASEKYEEVVTTATRISGHPDFERSRSNFLYGLSLFKTGVVEEAEIVLRKIDRRYSNYEERLVLATFLSENGKNEDALEILNALLEEGEYLTKPNQKLYRSTFQEIHELQKKLAY